MVELKKYELKEANYKEANIMSLSWQLQYVYGNRNENNG